MKKVLSVLLTALMLLNLGLSAFAVECVQSIEAKTAPEVVEMEYEGQKYGGLIIDGETGEVKEGVPLYDPDDPSSLLEFEVISIADVTQETLPELTDRMQRALEQIKNADSLDDLSAGLREQLQKWIDDYYGDSPEKPDIDDLVITDLFDADLIRDKIQVVHLEDGDKFQFKLKPNFGPDEFFVLLHNIEGTDWQVEFDVKWTEDGCLLITVSRLGVFAFARLAKANLGVYPYGPNSPQTGDGEGFNFLFAGCAVLCVAAAGFFFVKATKRKVKAK